MDIAELTCDERRWLEEDEQRWRLARVIVDRHPELDVGDVYHTIFNFERAPAERLRRGLRRGSARPDGR